MVHSETQLEYVTVYHIPYVTQNSVIILFCEFDSNVSIGTK